MREAASDAARENIKEEFKKLLEQNAQAFYDEACDHTAPISEVVTSLVAFAAYYDALVGKGVFSKVGIFGVKWGSNLDFEKFKQQIEANVWSEDLFMLELLPGHLQQGVLPNIFPFVKKAYQNMVKTRHDITESSKYFAAVQAQTAALLWAFPYEDRKIKTLADWYREGKNNPNSNAAKSSELIYKTLSQHWMLVTPL
eukprot:g48384.t1